MRILLSLSAACMLTAAAFAGNTDPRNALNQIPAWFEPGPSGTSYTSRSASLGLAVDPHGATIAGGNQSTRLSFPGSSRPAFLEGVDRQSGVTNYLVGNRPESWRRNVPHFQRVAARGVYPGIDVVYYSAGKNLEFDFVLDPGADPRAIRLRFSNARPALQSDGSILLAGGVRQLPPVAWQERDGRRIPVDSRYVVTRNGDVRFQLGAYDKTQPLTIDPVIAWAGYIGGAQQEIVNGVVADSDGGFWLAGSATSTITVPDGTSPYSGDPLSTKDAFIAKITPDGNAWKLAYFSYVGGAADDEATAITMLGTRVAITGNTLSTDFPQTANTFQHDNAGLTDAFVVLYDPAASGTDCLTFSSYYGGPGTEHAQAIAAGPNNTLAVVGYTDSGSLIGISDWSLQGANRGGMEAFLFVAKPLLNSPDCLNYSTFFGGSSTDLGTAVAIDSTGLVYFAGTSMSTDLPVSDNARYPYNLGSGDGFIAKINPNNAHFDGFLYGSYLGGDGLDSAQAIALDAQNRVWITGYTNSTNLPVSPGAYRTSLTGGFDSYLMRVDLTKTGAAFMDYCTYFGGSAADIAYALAYNPADGTATIAGYTNSPDYVAKNIGNYQSSGIRLTEMFAARFDPSKTGDNQLTWSLLYGGSGMDVVTGIALDQAGNVFIGGFTGSRYLNFGVDAGKPNQQGLTTGFFLKLNQQ